MRFHCVQLFISPAHRPDMTEKLLKKGRKIASYVSVHKIYLDICIMSTRASSIYNPYFIHCNCYCKILMYTTLFAVQLILNGNEKYMKYSIAIAFCLMIIHCKKSVDFTVKYLTSGCQLFYRHFYGFYL